MSKTTTNSRRLISAAFISGAMVYPSLAHAHIGIGQSGGLMHGLSHPFLGLDHLCAMLAVGLWSMQMGGRRVWQMPLAFVVIMAMGGILGMSGIPVSHAELGIAMSLPVLGVLIAASVRLPLMPGASMVGIFALCHGYAHGAGIPQGTVDYAYAAGFLLATAMLHALGIGLAKLAQIMDRAWLLRLAGVAIAVFGGSILLAA